MKYLNLFIAALCLLIGGIAGWKMSSEQLWSHLPLFLFLGTWIGLVLVYDFFFLKNIKNARKYLFYSAIAGLLLAVGFPPYGLTPLMFIGFIPLLIIQKECDDSGENSLIYIYNALVLWNIYASYWVSNAALVPGIVAIWLNAIFMLVPWYLSVWIGRKKSSLQGIALICFWSCFEFLHLNWEISWPWLNLGNAWSAIPSWIQWYEFTGTFGGTIWILGMNVLIYSFFFKNRVYSNSLLNSFNKRMAIVGLCIIIPIVLSLLRYNTYIPSGKYGEVCVVQPNYEPHYEKFTVPEMDQITRLGRLAEKSMNENTKFVVFPETSCGEVGGPVRVDKLSVDNRIILWYDFIESHFNVPIVMGLTTINFLPADSRSKFKRTSRRNNENYEIANSAVILKDRLERPPVYNKSKLVPGAEIFPYRDFLPFLSPIVHKLGGTTAGLATNPERSVFESKGYKIAPVICYESIYGDFMRGYSNSGAEAIFVMTNDGWWDDTPGYKQHMAFSKLRAIELRKPVIRSANTGISCFINAKGELGKSLPYNVSSAISEGISFSDEISFYCKHGDYLAYICLIISILLIVFGVFKHFSLF